MFIYINTNLPPGPPDRGVSEKVNTDRHERSEHRHTHLFISHRPQGARFWFLWGHLVII